MQTTAEIDTLAAKAKKLPSCCLHGLPSLAFPLKHWTSNADTASSFIGKVGRPNSHQREIGCFHLERNEEEVKEEFLTSPAPPIQFRFVKAQLMEANHCVDVSLTKQLLSKINRILVLFLHP